jgi:threonine dehydrogenase-like Zn-dependent dehydrogenase
LIDAITGLAVYPGKPHSLHLRDLPARTAGPGEVVVRPRRVGICGTDREIIDAKFGQAPAGEPALVLGHEVLGTIEAVGDGVDRFLPGDLVGATVRRPDDCPACRVGQPDMCQWLTYNERGILRAHGFMAERFVEHTSNLVPVPSELEAVGVLLEPLSVVEKAFRQAVTIQRRIKNWRPSTAVVLGAGPIGLLQTLLLREQGADVWTFARTLAPNPVSRIVEAAGGHYVSLRQASLREVTAALPNVDLIIEATGVSDLVAQSAELLGNNGVLVLLSITGSDQHISIPLDAINRGFVLGNKVLVGSVNSAHADFLSGVARLRRFEQLWPGLTAQMITERLQGLEEALASGGARQGIKMVIEFAN